MLAVEYSPWDHGDRLRGLRQRHGGFVDRGRLNGIETAVGFRFGGDADGGQLDDVWGLCVQGAGGKQSQAGG
ncbi:hypothetical protein D3C78_1939640 [compost metagenome]